MNFCIQCSSVCQPDDSFTFTLSPPAFSIHFLQPIKLPNPSALSNGLRALPLSLKTDVRTGDITADSINPIRISVNMKGAPKMI